MTQSFRTGSRTSAQRRLRVETLEQRMVLNGEPFISEFQASNDSTVADEDGDFSDWIEIHNPDNTAVDLAGWYLTDDVDELQKWQFPPGTRLDANGYLVVFASGKDRAVAISQLHTNFRLSADGEDLILVRPDGVTFDPTFNPYPAQQVDVSYGVAAGREVTQLIDDEGPVAALVPTDDSLGIEWTRADFDDAAWMVGNGGVGFEDLHAGFVARNDFNHGLGPEWTIDNPGPATVTVGEGSVSLRLPNGLETSNDERGTSPIVYREVPPFAGDPNSTPISWEMTSSMSRGERDTGSLGLTVLDGNSQLPVIKLQYNSGSRFELRVNERREELVLDRNQDAFSLRIVRDGIARSWTAYYKIQAADPWIMIGSMFDGVDGMPIISDPTPALFAETQRGTMEATFDSVQFDVPGEPEVYGLETGLDVRDVMYNQSNSIYLRAPFVIDELPGRFEELTMRLQFDDGYRAYLNGVLVSEQNAPLAPPPPAPDEIPWDSAAAGTHGALNGVIPTTLVNLDTFVDSLKVGENVLAIHGLNAEHDHRDFFLSMELLGSDFVNRRAQLFTAPTPGSSNAMPAPSPPIIIGQQGMFYGRRRVELELAEPSPRLEIRYTLDGSEPTEESRLYEGPFTLTHSAMLQARVMDGSPDTEVEPSPVASATFIAADPELQERTSDVPIVVIDTLQEVVPPSGSNSLVPVNVVALDVSRATGRSSFETVVDYLGRGGIRERGSSSSGQPRPNLAFETWGAAGTDADDDEDVSLLGFASESDWVLHAPYGFDRALLRNQLAFDISNQMGRWAPDTRVVEVYLNRHDGVVTEDDYMGVYVLMEKIKQGEDRVDIAAIDRDDNTEPEISGGFIWKTDRLDPDGGAFEAGGHRFNWVYPKGLTSRTARDDQKVTPEQQAWVDQYFDQVDERLRTTVIGDPDGYEEYVDVDSWIDHHLISVVLHDADSFSASAYLFKDRGGKLARGPIWDFDRTIEAANVFEDAPSTWAGTPAIDFFGRHWYQFVFQDPGFWQRYVDRWTELHQTVFSRENIDATLDRLASELEESQERNFAAAVTQEVLPRTSPLGTSLELDGTWRGEVEHARAWLHKRIGFIDSNFTQPPQVLVGGLRVPTVDQVGQLVKGLTVAPGASIEIRSAPFTVFDDERLLDTSTGAVMGTYFAPSDDSLETDWAQPGFDDGAWSSGAMGLGFDTEGELSDLIQTDVQLPEGGTTLLTRMTFEVDDLAKVKDHLFLQMIYDDGFVAYLNGTEFMRYRVRDPELSWNSRAYTRGPAAGARAVQEFDISDARDLLVEGENVLALRIVNQSATDSDLLIQPQLVSRGFVDETNPLAKVYYTLDGADPRGADGEPSASARLLSPGETITIPHNTRLMARNLDDTYDFGPESAVVLTNWSAPIELDLSVSSPDLVISEIHYNPAAATQSEVLAGFSTQDFEFVEILNRGDTAANLVGIKLSDGVEFDFFNGSMTTLGPGEYAIVAANQAAFADRYGAELPVAGEYGGNLSNSGEEVELEDGTGTVISSVSYGVNELWPSRADGLGASLEMISPRQTPLEQQSKWYRWSGSFALGGSPGAAADERLGIVVNEVLANTRDIDITDTIELFNVSAQPVDLTGWYLSDSSNDFFKFAIPAGTVLEPGDYVVYDEEDFDFGLNGVDGESVWLVRRGDGNEVVAFGDEVRFGPTVAGESLGRTPNGTGRLTPLEDRTLGGTNGMPRFGPLVISEIQYHPKVSDAALAVDPALNLGDLEFVEIFNPTNETVDLTGWRLRGGIDYEFDAGLQLDDSESIVVLRFNPDDPENIKRLNAFRIHYGLDDNVRLVGGYQGQLNNDGDRVTLLRPYLPVPVDPSTLTYVHVDEVLYDDQPDWPTEADGLGPSLQRRDPASFGNHGASFVAVSATPGSLFGSGGDFDGDGQLDASDINLMLAQLRSASPDIGFDLTEDGVVDADDRDRLVLDLFNTTYGDANLDGVFNSDDLVHVFIRGTYSDAIALNSGWEEGDWDGDGEFDSEDFVLAFRFGNYVSDVPLTPFVHAASWGAAIEASKRDVSVGGRVSVSGAMCRECIDSSRPRLLEVAAVESLFMRETDDTILERRGAPEIGSERDTELDITTAVDGNRHHKRVD